MPSRRKVFDMFGGKCAYCGCDLDANNFHIDHIIPIKSGGKKDNDNVFPTCPDCNNFKCDRTLAEFRKRIEEIQCENIATRMMAKYYSVEKKQISFYFEVKHNGDL